MLELIEQQLTSLTDAGLRRRRRVAATPCAAEVDVDGRAMLAFCSNDYLGLAAHPQIRQALQDGVNLYGAGSGASHLISGHTRAHAQLEDRLAEMLAPCIDDVRALYLSTGYMANLAVLSGLAASDPGKTEIFSEQLNHASLIDGARLARCPVKVFPHADLAALEIALQQSQARTKIVVTDSVFSMDGVIAPLTDMLALCERYQAWLVVDDAHGFGVLGEHGAGVLEHLHLRSKKLIYMGTLGKAAGVAGAFIAAHASVIEWLIQKARAYIYTTAAPPALAHALLTSLNIITGTEGVQRRAHLAQLIGQFKHGIGDAPVGLRLLASDTQIQPLVVGENQRAMQFAAQLFDAGLWVPAIRPPTVPAGTARLRVTLSAAHSSAQVAVLLQQIHNLKVVA